MTRPVPLAPLPLDRLRFLATRGAALASLRQREPERAVEECGERDVTAGHAHTVRTATRSWERE